MMSKIVSRVHEFKEAQSEVARCSKDANRATRGWKPLEWKV